MKSILLRLSSYKVYFGFSRLASVQTQVILSGGKDINDPKVMTKLLAACEVKLKCFD